MNTPLHIDGQEVCLIAALHLPPLPGSGHPMARSIDEVVDYARRNAEIAFRNGIDALYIQDLSDYPVDREVEPYTIASMAAVGYALFRAFPDKILGICLMEHGAREPLGIARAIGAQFVRLKVYVGAMVKAEGILEGCAAEAIQYRAQIGAQEVAILADIYDRTGMPLAPLPLVEAARQAVTFGRADGLILTGQSFDESLEMLAQVPAAGLGVSLFLGGGADAGNVFRALKVADGVIVSSALKDTPGWSRAALASEWSEDNVKAFVAAARGQCGQ